METAKKEAVTIENLTYHYDEAVAPAIDDVSFSIYEGEFFAVVGHNGSGKSTLAKHINALHVPTSGKVTVFDMDTSNEALHLKIREQVGIVFQNPDNQIVTTVVEEDVAFGPENLGVEPKEIRKRVDDALTKVGMIEYKNNAPHMLSGGQKQRIAIAGMLAMRPKILVLDEATAMLDPKGRDEVLSIVRELNRSEGITVIMITQYMEEAAMADRMAVMSHGRLEMLDTPRRIFSQSKRLQSMGLDVPAIVELRNSLIARGFIPTRAINTDELADAIAAAWRGGRDS